MAPLLRVAILENLRRFGGLLLHRAGIQALGVDVAVDELDNGHRGIVAVAEAGLDDAGVAALAVLVAGRQRVEQLPDLILVAHLGDRLAAHGEAALLAEGDQLLDDRAQFLRLRERSDDLLVLDQRRAHIGEHRAAMLGGAVELTMNLAVTHLNYSFYSSRRFVGLVAQVGFLCSPQSFRGARKREPGISRFRIAASRRPE